MRRSLNLVTLTPTATADGANLADSTYPFIIQGGASTQLIRIWEIFMSGQEGATSKVTPMVMSGDSTIGTGTNTYDTAGANLRDVPLPGESLSALSAPAKTGNKWATTKPVRDATDHRMYCGFNAYGGNFYTRFNKAEECPTIFGNTASKGEVSISCMDAPGTPGAFGGHLVYEPF